MNKGGHVTVIGWVTGVHFIEDIKCAIPYGTAVTIPASDVVRSRDLQIAIQQRRVIEVENMMGNRAQTSSQAQPQSPPPSIPPEELDALRSANEQLTKSVDELRKQNQVQQSQFQMIIDALGSLGSKEVHHHHHGSGGNGSVGSDVVGGEVPKFIPSQIKQEGTEGRITMQTSTAMDEESFAKSVERLRELRKKQPDS